MQEGMCVYSMCIAYSGSYGVFPLEGGVVCETDSQSEVVDDVLDKVRHNEAKYCVSATAIAFLFSVTFQMTLLSLRNASDSGV